MYDFYQEFQRRNHSVILSNSRQGYAKLNIFHLLTLLTQQTCTNPDPVRGTQLWFEWNGSRVRMPFLPEEEIIPIMPFLTVLLDNFRFIPLFLGRGPNLRTQSKRLNMERTARGSAQMFACCSSAPAASTSQLGGRADRSPNPSHR